MNFKKNRLLIIFIPIFYYQIGNAEINSGVGPHSILFTLEKNRHPENSMVIYTKTDENCRFKKTKNDKRPVVFDFYWLMDHKTFKPVNPMIKHEIRKRLELNPAADTQSFSILINDLKEVDTDIKDLKMTVESHKIKGQCETNAVITLGPSDKNAKIKLESIYAESKGLFIPSISAITLKGTNVLTGQLVTRKYSGRQ